MVQALPLIDTELSAEACLKNVLILFFFLKNKKVGEFAAAFSEHVVMLLLDVLLITLVMR